MSQPEIDTELSIPLVVQLGFAGSRYLLKTEEHPGVNEAEFHAQVEDYLCGVMREMPRKLDLTERYFLCGVSQIAIGADMIFARVCRRLGILQRIFLPQHRDAYFAATDENGERDFTDAQVQDAQALLGSGHVIEDRLVSQSPMRSERFEDVNLEVARVSEVLVALLRADADAKQGGTADLVEKAAARHKPLLEIRVAVRDGQPFFSEKWHANKPPERTESSPRFKPPGIPPVLKDCRFQDGVNYANTLKEFSSAQSKKLQGFFIWAALAIIGTHFFATVCAVTGVVFHENCEDVHRWLLGGELALLATGLAFHLVLHRSHAARQWATARLVSGIARSVISMRQVPGYLGHLFMVPLPEFLRPLSRTLNVFHLQATRKLDPSTWSARRNAYVHSRLTHPNDGQIPYYKEQHLKACRWLQLANSVFYIGSLTAFLATLTELFTVCKCHFLPCSCAFIEWLEQQGTFIERGPGFLALILPVLSVAALSLAASFDLEARKHTYKEMVDALEERKQLIEGAKSEREFATLVLQTEARLVGENVNWFSRRAFIGVA